MANKKDEFKEVPSKVKPQGNEINNLDILSDHSLDEAPDVSSYSDANIVDVNDDYYQLKLKDIQFKIKLFENNCDNDGNILISELKTSLHKAFPKLTQTQINDITIKMGNNNDSEYFQLTSFINNNDKLYLISIAIFGYINKMQRRQITEIFEGVDLELSDTPCIDNDEDLETLFPTLMMFKSKEQSLNQEVGRLKKINQHKDQALTLLQEEEKYLTETKLSLEFQNTQLNKQYSDLYVENKMLHENNVKILKELSEEKTQNEVQIKQLQEAIEGLKQKYEESEQKSKTLAIESEVMLRENQQLKRDQDKLKIENQNLQKKWKQATMAMITLRGAAEQALTPMIASFKKPSVIIEESDPSLHLHQRSTSSHIFKLNDNIRERTPMSKPRMFDSTRSISLDEWTMYIDDGNITDMEQSTNTNTNNNTNNNINNKDDSTPIPTAFHGPRMPVKTRSFDSNRSLLRGPQLKKRVSFASTTLESPLFVANASSRRSSFVDGTDIKWDDINKKPTPIDVSNNIYVQNKVSNKSKYLLSPPDKDPTPIGGKNTDSPMSPLEQFFLDTFSGDDKLSQKNYSIQLNDDNSNNTIKYKNNNYRNNGNTNDNDINGSIHSNNIFTLNNISNDDDDFIKQGTFDDFTNFMENIFKTNSIGSQNETELMQTLRKPMFQNDPSTNSQGSSMKVFDILQSASNINANNPDHITSPIETDVKVNENDIIPEENISLLPTKNENENKNKNTKKPKILKKYQKYKQKKKNAGYSCTFLFDIFPKF